MGKEFNEMILRNVARSRARTQSLKERSDYYPAVLIEEEPADHPTYKGYCFVASTLLRKEHEGTWYTIHHVERHCCEIQDKDLALEASTGHMLRRLALGIYNAQHLYIITGRMEDVDKLQISEEERLLSLIPKRKEA